MSTAKHKKINQQPEAESGDSDHNSKSLDFLRNQQSLGL